MKRQIKFLKENYLLTIGFSLMFLSSVTAVIDMAMRKKGPFPIFDNYMAFCDYASPSYPCGKA